MAGKSDEVMEMLEKHTAQLMEHFEACQIFVTRTEGHNTVSADRGAGNWHARNGQVRDWIEANNEQTRINARNNQTG